MEDEDGPVPRIEYDDDLSVVEDYGADRQEVAQYLVRYGKGECAPLAARMHEITGWPIFHLKTWQHFCVQRPDGALVDVYGVFPPEFGFSHIAQRYEMPASAWEEETEPSLWCDIEDEDRSDADKFLATAWGLTILPLSVRLAEPLTYPLSYDD